jgi:hypothetical protein
LDLVSHNDTVIVECLRQLGTLPAMFAEEGMAEFYFNFTDEAAYVGTIGHQAAESIFSYLNELRLPVNSDVSAPVALSSLSEAERLLVTHLIRDSNLYKLLGTFSGFLSH